MSIRMGYILYASLATLIGGILGSIAGFFYIINQVIENNNINIEDIIIDENSLAMNS